MPFPLTAAVSLAAIAGNLDCDPHADDNVVDDTTANKKEENSKTEKKPASVRFDPQSPRAAIGGPPVIDSVRSSSSLDQEASSMFNIITRDGSVHLRRSEKKLKTDETTAGISYSAPTTPQGYMDGSFSSGVTHEVRPGSGSFVLQYSESLLAIGTVDGLELYETRNYTRIYLIPTRDEVSAIRWIQLHDDDSVEAETNNDDVIKKRTSSSSSLKMGLVPPSQQLLAFGCLDGNCFVYQIYNELIEVDGAVSLLYSCRMDGQIRATDYAFFHSVHSKIKDHVPLHSTIAIAFGDKLGTVKMLSLDRTMLQIVESVDCEQNSSAVLGLCIHPKKRWMARCTKSGHVAVFQLTTKTRNGRKSDATNPVAVVDYGACLWETQREGPVLAVRFSHSGNLLTFGGYDKTVALIDTSAWATLRSLKMEGTVNVIAMDPLDRYIAVGCRDRSLSLLDSSTYMKIKGFQTNGWVTDISWKPCTSQSNCGMDVLAFRSKRHLVSILNLQPIELTNIQLSSRHGLDTSLSWSADGRLLVRSHGASIFVVDVDQNFQPVASANFNATVIQVAFCHANNRQDCLAVVDESGHVSLLRLLSAANARTKEDATVLSGTSMSLRTEVTSMLEVGVKTMMWSPDGSILALGGKQKLLHLLDSSNLKPARESLKLDGRLWDIAFAHTSSKKSDDVTSDDIYIVLALGDYTCIALNRNLETILRFLRPRTARCLAIHPRNPALLVVGDGAGTVAVVDTKAAEMVHEIKAGGGRINTLAFSPIGDYLIVGTDDGHFNMYLEGLYQFAQQIPCKGFAICARFSPDGAHLALGSAGGSYSIVRLGPFLAIDLAPLKLQRGTSELPQWALAEVLYRSGYSESFLQRHIQAGHSDNIQRLSSILKDYPTAVFAFDRSNNETFFDTALRVRRPMILKLAITALVDGTIESRHNTSILTTRLPKQARDALIDLLVNMNPELVSEILQEVEFIKVPYGQVHSVRNDRVFEKCSPLTSDPWGNGEKEFKLDFLESLSWWSSSASDLIEKKLTPAVLPLPGLGDMEFLSALLWKADPDAFDNAAMGIVLRVLWTDHIRIFFYMDFFLCMAFYGCWVALVEANVRLDSWGESIERPTKGLAIVVLLLNTAYGAKEIVEARLGRRSGYFRNFWNIADIISIVFVYAFVAYQLLPGYSQRILIPLAVATTFAMTIKIISYLRGFDGTGWLISVLSANFRDVRGFLFILCAILVGFSVAFRILFSQVNEDGFGSLRRSLLSTFELVTTGTYEPSMLYDAEWNVLAVLTFVLAVTCVLVIALNALISILADSYARVQVHAVANRRREQAGLIVEYMTLLPAQSRMRLEEKTKWFHCLLEVDSDGSLLLGREDWQGGLNELRKDLEELSHESREQNEKAMLQMKNELYSELASFRKETLELLENLSSEIKELKKAQSRGGITLNGRNVVSAVKAVKSIGQKTAKLMRNENS